MTIQNKTNLAHILLIASVLCVFLLSAHDVSAHGQVTSLKKTVGSYLVEFEYNQAGNPAANDFVPYNFDILDAQTKEFVTFKYAFVRFADAEDHVTYANANIAPDSFSLKSARMGMQLPSAGAYKVSVTFYDSKDNEIADTNFDFTVDPPYEENNLSSDFQKYLWILTLVVGLLIGMGASKIFKARKTSG